MLRFTVVDVHLLRRGNIRPEGIAYPVGASSITNSLAGLRTDAAYMAWMRQLWGRLATPRQMQEWLAEDVPGRLTRAATHTREHGTIPYGDLADLLELVRYKGDGETITVPSLPTLAAWAFVRGVESGHQISVCGECNNVWLSRQPVEYCYRPAPGKTTTCAQLHAHARFAEQREQWNKEYRRIYARKLRGTVTQAEWKAWNTETAPLREAGWIVPFDLWKETKQTGNWLHVWEHFYGPEEGRRLEAEIEAQVQAKSKPQTRIDWVAAMEFLQQPVPVEPYLEPTKQRVPR
jgi:Zn-finger nucleic acid-binding protein